MGEPGVVHGTFEITLYPNATDLLSSPVALQASEAYPVTALYRPPGSLSARRAGGAFALDPDRLLEAGFGDPKEYGRALGEGLFRGAIRDLFRNALAATPATDSLHVLLSLEAP